MSKLNAKNTVSDGGIRGGGLQQPVICVNSVKRGFDASR
jgi:hypothetical protein